MSAGHSHDHSAQKNIAVAFGLNAFFVVIEIAGGLWTGSVAILADAVHDLGDCLSLGIAWALQRMSQQKRTEEFSYGYGRLSLLAALLSSMVIAAGSILVLIVTIPRLWENQEPHGLGMMILAVFGLAVNGFAALKLSHGDTMNEKVLTWHFIEDILGWAAVLIGSLLIYFLSWNWVDPVLALFIAGYVLFNVFRYLKNSARLFLQSTPEGFNEVKFKEGIFTIAGIQDIHDLHIWSLDGTNHVLSLHIKVDSQVIQAADAKQKIRAIAAEMGHYHTTIEVEEPTEDCGDSC